jgi:hypothetical protein
MKIELSDDAVEDIVCATLKEHIKYCKKNIKDLTAKRKAGGLKDFEEEDLIHNMTMLNSLKDVHGYFGGNL